MRPVSAVQGHERREDQVRVPRLRLGLGRLHHARGAVQDVQSVLLSQQRGHQRRDQDRRTGACWLLARDCNSLVHEQDALGNFDESGTDPVSAAFAQIQSAHQQANQSTAPNSAASQSDQQANNNEEEIALNGNAEQNSLNSSAELHEDESRDDSVSTPVTERTEHEAPGHESRDLPGPSAQRTSLQKIDLSASVDLTDYLKTNSPRDAPNMEREEPEERGADMSREVSTADMNDVLEKLYQKAIEDMAARAFHAADVNKDGKISFEVRVMHGVCVVY